MHEGAFSPELHLFCLGIEVVLRFTQPTNEGIHVKAAGVLTLHLVMFTRDHAIETEEVIVAQDSH